MIGRVHTVHPLNGDELYLRILRHHDHCKGTPNFGELLTVNNIIHASYEAVRRTLGLLQDDEEWNTVFQEAALSKLCPRITSLFATILLFCQPSIPLLLFNNHAEYWCDDLGHKIPAATEDQLKVMILEDVEDKLLPNNKTQGDIGLPCLTVQNRQQVQQLTEHQGMHNQRNVIQEELGLDNEELKIKAHQCLLMLTPSQK